LKNILLHILRARCAPDDADTHDDSKPQSPSLGFDEEIQPNPEDHTGDIHLQVPHKLHVMLARQRGLNLPLHHNCLYSRIRAQTINHTQEMEELAGRHMCTPTRTCNLVCPRAASAAESPLRKRGCTSKRTKNSEDGMTELYAKETRVLTEECSRKSAHGRVLTEECSRKRSALLPWMSTTNVTHTGVNHRNTKPLDWVCAIVRTHHCLGSLWNSFSSQAGTASTITSRCSKCDHKQAQQARSQAGAASAITSRHSKRDHKQ
jgi:hypothetical protein